MKRTSIRFAIQRDGRLRAASVEVLRSLGLAIPEQNGRTLIVPCENADAEILYVRHSDVPQYVQSGAADFAVVGGNLLHENSFKVKTLKDLGFGECRLVLAVPNGSGAKEAQDLEGERIATSYPNSLRQFLAESQINAVVLKIKGSVEVAPALGMADAICDLTQTGNTIKENGLRIIETLFHSEAKLIESPFSSEPKRAFAERFLGGLA